MSIKELLLGKPLKNNELKNEKLNTVWGVPIMASDAVSSVAYAIEEILLVIVPVLGAVSIKYLGFIAMPVILLLMILVFSYTQVINHYPGGGGAYVVSSENLGKTTSLITASALIIDYIMTVSVSISSATSAMLSAFPILTNYRVLVAVLFLSFITLMNLRGIRESAKLFGIPTYAFIAIMFILILNGLIKLINGTLAPIRYEHVATPAGSISDMFIVFIFLKAFSSGCSALTGVEAVSDAVPSFKSPEQRTAKRVLFILLGIIFTIFGGSVLLARGLNVEPLANKTVLSQMGLAVFGNSFLYYFLQFATSLVLILAANTAYNGLPTLLSILAKDGYLPRQFTQRGSKLSFSNGIMFIFIISGLLIISFKANTHHLIPLYSVGVFISFTLSQFGMVVKMKKSKEKGWVHKSFINGFGAFMTFVTCIIVFSTKFKDGAWILAVIIPLIVIIMKRIKNHYVFIGEQISISTDEFKKHFVKSTSTNTHPCIVLAGSMSRSVLKTINYANRLTSNVTVLHISTDYERKEKFLNDWNKIGLDVKLDIIDATYRDIIPPFSKYISEKEATLNHGEDISVIMTKFVEQRWYDNLFHNQTTYFIERILRTHKNVTTIIVPYLYRKEFTPKSEE